MKQKRIIQLIVIPAQAGIWILTGIRQHLSSNMAAQYALHFSTPFYSGSGFLPSKE